MLIGYNDNGSRLRNIIDILTKKTAYQSVSMEESNSDYQKKEKN